MKLNTLKIILILSVLLISQIAETNQKATFAKAKNLLSKSKINKMQTENSTYLKKLWLNLSESMAQPKNYLHFLLGATSAWVPESEKVYKHLLKNPSAKIDEMVSKCKSSTWDPSFKKADSKGVKDLPSLSANWNELDSAKKAKLCTKMKVTFWTYHTMKPTSVGGIFEECIGNICNTLKDPIGKIIEETKDIVKENYCTPNNLTTVKPQIEKIWGTFQNYKNECEFFADMKCSDAEAIQTPSYGSVINFLTKAHNFFDFVTSGVDCIRNMSDVTKELTKAVPEASKIFESKISNTISFVANFAVQILTAGAWGVIKGTFLLLKMGYGLQKLLTGGKEELPYKLGQLVGIGMRAASTFVFGSKK